MKLKWLTSLVVMIALTGSVWAGVCGCFDEQHGSHSCCKKDSAGPDSMAAKGCCSADCETIIASAGEMPQKQNSDNAHLKAPAKAIETSRMTKIEWLLPALRRDTQTPFTHTGDNRLRLARGPDLYLRHNSFLI